ncbi:MAG TPA: glycosyltransferase [Thermotogota bacterium]|nr:glycosyltransferase [Thermotogota bacterium]
MEQKKISILVPTYNDEKYIQTLIESVLVQTYKDWELLIMDDGSEDGTADIIRRYSDKRIHYYHQNNAGQLNALYTLSDQVESDLALLIHSDDCFVDEGCLEKNVDFFNMTDAPAIYSDIITIDASGKQTGRIKTEERLSEKSDLKYLFLNGSNIVSDPFFAKKDFFRKYILKNYIRWNIPYWLTADKESLPQKSPHPWYKYRVFEENYFFSDIGRFVHLNGTLRGLIEVFRRKNVPFFNSQRLLFKLGLTEGLFLNPNEHFEKKLCTIMKRLEKRFVEDGFSKDYLYRCHQYWSGNNKRMLEIDETLCRTIDELPLYYGKDARKFYKDYTNNECPQIYPFLLEEMQKGFFKIRVKEEFARKIQVVCKFLNIEPIIETV